MQKMIITNDVLNQSQLINRGEFSFIYRLSDGSILKVFDPSFVFSSKIVGIDLERRILGCNPGMLSSEVITPTKVVYSSFGSFCGYTMKEAKGITYNDYDDTLTLEDRSNLLKYASLHSKVEKVLQKNPNVVFPDLCTCDNIIITPNGNVLFIDFDGLQVGKEIALGLSTSVGDIEDYIEQSKYCKDLVFTKELDKKSSIFLYFLTAFNISLNKVGMVNPSNGKVVSLEDIFRTINLDDPDLCHKVWKLFQKDVSNEYLGNTPFDIANKYNLEVFGKYNGNYLKRLSKKK